MCVDAWVGEEGERQMLVRENKFCIIFNFKILYIEIYFRRKREKIEWSLFFQFYID